MRFLDGGERTYLVLILRRNPNPVLAAFAMTAASAPERKLDHLGVGKEVQALHADARIILFFAPNENDTHLDPTILL
jgi:hypothetical protein